MNRHLTMDELLSQRGGEGERSVKAHLDACPACTHEYDQLAQRVAALRALGTRRPPRDRWPVVRARLVAEQRHRMVRRVGIAVTAVAASLALAAALRPSRAVESDAPAASEVATLQDRSRELEGLLASYGTQGRVVDGRTAAVIGDIEDRIALVDAGLMQARNVNARTEDVTDLWRGRVELMNALVNAHVSRANYVGF